MEFELSLTPDVAAGLPRLRVISQARAGRARTQKQTIIWHDSPDRALASAGLALADQRGVWRLERLTPGAEDWPPAAPAPVLGQEADRGQLDVTLPDIVAPVAAFEGQVTDHVITTDDGPVTVQHLRGGLRSVTAAREVARLRLTGSDPGVLFVARALCDAIPVAVPRASLAAEALAAAHGTDPPARRLGAPGLPASASIGDAFGHALGHLTDVILHFAPAAASGDSGPEPVHQMRVAVRRLRSAITIFRAAIVSEPVTAADAGLKALAAMLGPTRDWDVFVTETAPAITGMLDQDARLQRMLGAAERRRAECHAALRTYLEGPAFRRFGIELAWLAGARSWHETLGPAEQELLGQNLAVFAAHVLHRRVKKLRAAGEAIETLDIPSLHALRLRAKRLRYAAEILAPLFPAKPARRFIARLSVLQARLGVLNDGAVAAHLMAELGGPGGRHAYAIGLVTGFSAARTSTIRPKIIRAWERLVRQPTFW